MLLRGRDYASKVGSLTVIDAVGIKDKQCTITKLKPEKGMLPSVFESRVHVLQPCGHCRKLWI